MSSRYKVLVEHPLENVLQVASGSSHILFLTSKGLYSSGNNDYGQLGHVSPTLDKVDVQNIVYVAAGEHHSMALDCYGRVYAWGKNDVGQCGFGQAQADKPKVLSIKGALVECGKSFSIILTPSHEVLFLQNGLHYLVRGVPIQQIAAGGHHVALLSAKGQVYVAGRNNVGQLGLDDTKNIDEPVVLDVSQEVSHIACGEYNTVLLTKSNKVHVYGNAHTLSGALTFPEKSFEWVNCSKNDVFLKSNTQSWYRLDEAQQLEECQFSGLQCASLSDDVYTASNNFKPTFIFDTSNVTSINYYYQSLQDPFSEAHKLKMDFRMVERQLKEISLLEKEFLFIYILIAAKRPVGYQLLERLSKDEMALLADIWQAKPIALELTIKHIHTTLNKKKGFDKEIRLLCKLWCINNQTLTPTRPSQSTLVDFTLFYNPTLSKSTEYMEIMLNSDAFPWIIVLDMDAKQLMLDLTHQKQMLLQQTHSFIHFLQSGFSTRISPFTTLKLCRSNLIVDIQQELSAKNSEQLKKPLKIHFIGEDGIDEGGVKKEFVSLFWDQILQMDCFKEAQDGLGNGYLKYLWFNSASKAPLALYHLIGRVLGLGLYNSCLCSISFPPCFYKKLANYSVGLADLNVFQPNLVTNLQKLLDYEADDVETIFGLDFTITEQQDGKWVDVPLLNTPTTVTQQNKQDYVNLYVDYLLNTSINKQFEALKNGFLEIVNSTTLNALAPIELETIMRGSDVFDFNDLEKTTIYKEPFTCSHPVILCFWRIVHAFNFDLKRRFIKFVTGTDRIPNHGLGEIKLTIQRTDGGHSTADARPVRRGKRKREEESELPLGVRLPSSHTCTHVLDLPEYTSDDVMEKCLTYAILHGEGFYLA